MGLITSVVLIAAAQCLSLGAPLECGEHVSRAGHVRAAPGIAQKPGGGAPTRKLRAFEVSRFSSPGKESVELIGLLKRADSLAEARGKAVFPVGPDKSYLSACPVFVAQLTVRAAQDGGSAEALSPLLRGLSEAFSGDNAINASVAELVGMRGDSLLSYAVLRERFRDLSPKALRAEADTATASERLKGMINRVLAMLGYSAPAEPTVNELAIGNAQQLLDRGQLKEALFELSAVGPEVQRALAVWIIQARIRARYDDSVHQLLQHVIQRCNTTTQN